MTRTVSLIYNYWSYDPLNIENKDMVLLMPILYPKNGLRYLHALIYNCGEPQGDTQYTRTVTLACLLLMLLPLEICNEKIVLIWYIFFLLKTI